jgi:hypothetical protein
MRVIKRKNVLQDWLSDLSWKKQTVLISALRGPDVGSTPEIKQVCRWIRSTILENADPVKKYMQVDSLPDFKDIVRANPQAVDMLSVHFLHHLMTAIEIIAYYHPKNNTKGEALAWYFKGAHYLNLEPESKESLANRLVDFQKTREAGLVIK